MKSKVLLRNDKVVLLKEYGDLKQVGDTYEVANFTDELVILRNERTKIAVGAISLVDFYEYFEKKKDVRFKYTKWTNIIDSTTDGIIGFYRTNFKKVQVMLPIKYNGSYIRAESSCNKDDEFDLWFGIKLAFSRAKVKAFDKIILPKETSALSKSRKDYKQTKNAIINMLASLKSKE